MANINYINLYSYLRDKEELTASECLRNIWRIRRLPIEFKVVVWNILEGNLKEIADFSVDGISMKKLIKEEKMKFIQSVFFLDWLRREPINARAYMASKRFRNGCAPVLNANERDKILKKIENLNKDRKEEVSDYIVPEDSSKTDVNTEDSQNMN